jgi:hypothetical protein
MLQAQHVARICAFWCQSGRTGPVDVNREGSAEIPLDRIDWIADHVIGGEPALMIFRV